MKKLIIIPAFNEEANIEKTVTAIQESARGFDYVIINDCSTDRTREICESRGYNIVNLPINLGIGGAVQTGYKYAFEYGYDVAVQVDGDGQHDPGFLSVMAEYMEQNKVDMVIGSRFIEKKGFQSSAARRMGIKFFSQLCNLILFDCIICQILCLNFFHCLRLPISFRIGTSGSTSGSSLRSIFTIPVYM